MEVTLSEGLIVIFDSETDYALKLAEYFNLKSGLNYSVSVFTEFNALKNELSNQRIDILIISEDFLSEKSVFEHILNIFILTEGNTYPDCPDFHFLYKYQSADVIIKEVMSFYAAVPANTKKLFNGSPAKITGVYSPINRCGKTSFALTYGCQKAINETCLYLNFEEYSGFSYFLSHSPNGDLSELIYFYHQNPENLDKKLLALSHDFYNLKFIPPMQFGWDIKNIETEDLKSFIKAIANTQLYQHLILDISESIKDIPNFLDICDVIYMPILSDTLSQHKLEEFFRIINATSDSLKEKLKPLNLPSIDTDKLFHHSHPIHSSGFPEHLLFGELGSYIRQHIKDA